MTFVQGAATVIARADRALRVVEKGGIAVAGALMFAIMSVVVIDVLLRYFFNSPLSWSFELISLYLMVGLFFFALSDTLANHAHVAVDILHLYIRTQWRHAAVLVGYVLAIPVFAAIFWLSLQTTVESYRGGDVLAGHIAWPTWIAQVCVPIGVGVLWLRIVLRTVGHALSLAVGRSVMSLPPVSGSEERV